MESLLILPHESLICSICYDILDHPLECNNCHNLFCGNCIKDYLNSKDKFRRLYYCPLCRSKRNNFSENVEVNNLLSEYKKSGKKLCIKCNNVVEKNKYKSHINKCWHKCSKCQKIFIDENKFLKHFDTHGKKEMDNLINTSSNKKIELNKKLKEEKSEDDFGKIRREKFVNNLNNSNLNETKTNNSIQIIDKNDYNPKYNLYFCGQNNNIKCSCCMNKKCCPYGELCVNCMRKNQKFHGLKKHYLINKKGKVCRYSHGSFHCNSTFDEIIEDNVGNFYKKQNICKGNYTCEACKNITSIMKYYLPTEVIKKLIERDL